MRKAKNSGFGRSHKPEVVDRFEQKSRRQPEGAAVPKNLKSTLQTRGLGETMLGCTEIKKLHFSFPFIGWVSM